MNRRGFLGAILAAAAAPAIVKAESLMKIWVPPEPKILLPDFGMGDGDFTVESFMRVPSRVLDEDWHHVAVVSKNGIRQCYVDGKVSNDYDFAQRLGRTLVFSDAMMYSVDTRESRVELNELRVTRGFAREQKQLILPARLKSISNHG